MPTKRRQMLIALAVMSWSIKAKRIMIHKLLRWIILAPCFFVDYSMGCEIFEYMQSDIPWNTTEIPNTDRVKLAEMVINARNWPDTQIRGVVQPRAYPNEINPQSLLDQRGANLKSYLLQLGIKEENFWMEPLILKDDKDRDANGKRYIHQLNVTLYPICEGGCARLCDDPRVTPVSKAIK